MQAALAAHCHSNHSPREGLSWPPLAEGPEGPELHGLLMSQSRRQSSGLEPAPRGPHGPRTRSCPSASRAPAAGEGGSGFQ